MNPQIVEQSLYGLIQNLVRYLCRFPDFLPNDFPLAGFVLPYGGQEGNALLSDQQNLGR